VNCLELRLKQALNLIHLYHSSNKRILFIGFPYIKDQVVLRSIQHFFIQKKFWVNGLFGNKNANIQNSNQKISLVGNPFVKKDPDLIVLFNVTVKDTNILKEVSVVGCPVIILGSQTFHKTNNVVCSVPGNFLKRNMKQLCFFLIYSILKKLKKYINFYD
jgi:ribosomal protein S2